MSLKPATASPRPGDLSARGETGPEQIDRLSPHTETSPVEGHDTGRGSGRGGYPVAISSGSGAGVVGVGIGAAAVALADRSSENAAAEPAPTSTSYPFYGEHQAGIVTPAQDRLHFAAFDVTTRRPGRS